MKGLIKIAQTILYIILLNLFFWALPLLFTSATPDITKPYQVWFNVLILLISVLPRGLEHEL